MTWDVDWIIDFAMTFDEWETALPPSVKRDGTWRVQAYRLALFFAAGAWRDLAVLTRDRRLALVAGQLCRAAGSIAANIAEGYGRRSPFDRARYFEYALGSAAEVRTWFIICRESLEPGLAERRIEQLASITRLLLVMIKSERSRAADGTIGASRRGRNTKSD